MTNGLTSGSDNLLFTELLKQTFDLESMVSKIIDENMKPQGSRQRILQTAVTLFARKGYAETGLRELAAAAEVNLSMINYFFGTKKTLLKEILDTFFAGYLKIAGETLTGPGNWRDKVERFIHRAIEYYDQHREYLLVTITELPHDDPEIIDHKANWAREMIGIIDQEICRPLLKETGRYIPPTSIGPMLVALMATRFIFGPVMEQVNPALVKKINLSGYAQMTTQVFLNGITGPPLREATL